MREQMRRKSHRCGFCLLPAGKRKEQAPQIATTSKEECILTWLALENDYRRDSCALQRDAAASTPYATSDSTKFAKTSNNDAKAIWSKRHCRDLSLHNAT